MELATLEPAACRPHRQDSGWTGATSVHPVLFTAEFLPGAPQGLGWSCWEGPGSSGRACHGPISAPHVTQRAVKCRHCAHFPLRILSLIWGHMVTGLLAG